MNKPEFLTKDVIACAVAAHRHNDGFVKSSAYDADGKTPNSKLLYNHFLGYSKPGQEPVFNKLDVVENDISTAEIIIDYLHGLSFKAIERKLTEFEANVLQLVTSDTITKDKIGIASSLPKVYYQKLEQDAWTDKELGFARTSEYVGKLHSRHNFTLSVENIRNIPSTGSYLFCCVSEGKDIVKFFHETDGNFNIGDVINVAGYIKSHSVSKYHNGKETMINRIKYADK